MDIDTPRDKKYINGENYRLEGQLSEFFFEENGVVKQFNITDKYFLIDTTVTPPRAWIRLKMTESANTSEILGRICVESLDLKLDSLDYSSPYSFNGRHSGNSWAMMKVQRGLNTSNDTTIYSGSETNNGELNFSVNLKKGEANGFLTARVLDYKIWKENRDSIYTEYISVTRLDTTYDNYGNMIIKQVTEKKPQQVKIVIEEEKRLQDSLFLNGRFKIKF